MWKYCEWICFTLGFEGDSKKASFEDADIDIDIHEPIYSVDYELVFDLVMAGLWHMYIYMTHMYVH